MSAPAAPNLFVAFDLETTGLFPTSDRVVEIGAVRFDASGRERGRFASLVDPERPCSPGARLVHGIADEELAGAPKPAEVLPRFLAWLDEEGPPTLLAHHARFDAGFLGRELARAGLDLPGLEVVDTLALARARLPAERSHRLDLLAERLGLEGGRSHRALGDSLRVMGLWLALDRMPGPRPPEVRYRLFDPAADDPAPSGWEELAAAMLRGARVRIEYDGGRRGGAPREISPRRFVHKGGRPYVVAHCHLDDLEKSFRLDRVVRFEVLGEAGGGPASLAAGRGSPLALGDEALGHRSGGASDGDG